jgi:hypothetical protein
MANGIRLKTAMKALMAALKTATKKNGFRSPRTKVRIKKTLHKTMFSDGPAMAVFPILSLLELPAIITAPGEIILKGDIIEIRVRRAPNIISRNSAHKP